MTPPYLVLSYFQGPTLLLKSLQQAAIAYRPLLTEVYLKPVTKNTWWQVRKNAIYVFYFVKKLSVWLSAKRVYFLMTIFTSLPGIAMTLTISLSFRKSDTLSSSKAAFSIAFLSASDGTSILNLTCPLI